MGKRTFANPVSVIATLVAGICVRECELLDALWARRHPRPFGALTKRRHRQFVGELIAYYSCICEDFLEGELPTPVDRFMDLVAIEAARTAARDPFFARPPYFKADLVEHGESRYLRRISTSRSTLKLMPPHVKAEWLAARTALALREILSEQSDDPNELSKIEVTLAQRLEWTARELTGE